MQAICSPDGNHVAIVLPSKKNNLECITLNFNNDQLPLIQKKRVFTIKDILVHYTFSHDSRTLFCLSGDRGDMNTSQLQIYDIERDTESSMAFDDLFLTMFSLNHNSSRMIASYLTPESNTEIHLFDLKDPLNPIFLHRINITYPYLVSALQYGHNTNTAAARLTNGNLLLIKENHDSTVSLSHAINQYKSTAKFCFPCLLFSDDDQLVIDHSILKREEDCVGRVISVWSTHAAKLAGQHVLLSTDTSISPMISINTIIPEIFTHKNRCSFLTNMAEHMWANTRLYTPTEALMIRCIETENDLFDLYLLRRLHRAHKNQQTIIKNNHDALFYFLDSLPTGKAHNMQACIKQYLLTGYKKKSSGRHTNQCNVAQSIHNNEKLFKNNK